MSSLTYTDCRECGRKMDAVFFCIHCAQRFCSQDCFRRHAAAHVNGSSVVMSPSVYGGTDWPSRRPSQVLPEWPSQFGM